MMKIEPVPKTVEDFVALAEELRKQEGFRAPLAFSIGVPVYTGGGMLASVRYPVVNGYQKNLGTAAILIHILNVPPRGVQVVKLNFPLISKILSYFSVFKNDGKEHPNINVLKGAWNLLWEAAQGRGGMHRILVAVFIFDDVELTGVEDATLKMHLLSERLVRPGEVTLNGLSKVLPTVVWQGGIPFGQADVDKALFDMAFVSGTTFSPARVGGRPAFVEHVNPLRLGVKVGPNVPLGTFVGIGAEVYGKILEGENDVPLSVGKNCRIEEGSVLGISVGDAVVVEEGCTVKGMTMVRVAHGLRSSEHRGKLIHAKFLEGISGVTFYFNPDEGVVGVKQTTRNQKLLGEIPKV